MNGFEEVRQRLDMVETVRLYGYEPNRAGFIVGPFHQEKTPSLKLYDGGRGWYCHGCHSGGDVVSFVAKLFGLRPLEAVKRLNTDFGY